MAPRTYAQVKAATLARMPTPALTWYRVDHTHPFYQDDASGLHGNECAYCFVTFADAKYLFVAHFRIDGTAGENPTPTVRYTVEQDIDANLGSSEYTVPGVTGTSWTELMTSMNTWWATHTATERDAYVNVDYVSELLGDAGVLLTDPIPTPPTIKERIHTVAETFDTWDTATTEALVANTNTREWFKTWIGYAWEEATKETPNESLRVLRVAVGAPQGTRTITGHDDIMEWILGNIEYWAEQGIASWVDTHNNAHLLALRGDRTLGHIKADGTAGEGIRGSFDTDVWDRFKGASYDAALAYEPPEA